jgi:CheY-like chemotaxis protein
MIRLSELDQPTGAAEAPSEAASECIAGPSQPYPVTPDTLRILCVDDNESNRSLVTAILRAQGFECSIAEDGARAVEAARHGCWSLILMDIQMPVIDGVEATRAIRSMPAPAGAVPIVALTANTQAEDLERYARAGIDDCIGKPFQARELLSKVIAWGATAVANPSAPRTAPSRLPTEAKGDSADQVG